MRVTHSISKAGALAVRLSRYVDNFGWRAGTSLFYRDRPSIGGVAEIETPWGARVCVRLGTSDVTTYRSVVLAEEYAADLPFTPRTIVDLGANIGLAAVWFAKRYPGARIVAVEPDRGNFALLEANTVALPQVQPACAAIWAEDRVVHMVDPGLGPWGLRVAEPTEAGPGVDVEAISMPTLMERFELERIDLLKIDVEGAERRLFDGDVAWLERVGAIAIELHDRFEPGCSRAFYRVTESFDVELHRGENTFLARSSWSVT